MDVQRNSLGLLGFGGFGRLIALHLSSHFDIKVCDPVCKETAWVNDQELPMVSIEELAACNVVVLAVPVSQIRASCVALAPFLRPGTIVVDVGSVKLEPIAAMVECLPDHVQIIGTHPLFGPQSTTQGLAGRKLTLCPVRGDAWRIARVFLARQLGLTVITCPPEEHDREVAVVQGLTHLIAKVLVDMGPLPSRMTTASFDLLTEAIDMVKDDPPTVLHAIEAANPFAAEVREAFFDRAEILRRRIEG